MHAAAGTAAAAPHSTQALGLSPNALQLWLGIAGIGCCVAMAMPQVHIVAYCVDLGYGAARGAEMLSIMTCRRHRQPDRLGLDRRPDRRHQDPAAGLDPRRRSRCCSISCSTGWSSLFLVSTLFGLVQGGIIPSYGVIVREYFPPSEAGMRMGIAISATIVGMALGGWMGGALFDLTGSYHAAFINGIAWNVLNGAMIWWLLARQTTAERLCIARRESIRPTPGGGSPPAWPLSTLGGIGMWALAVAMPAVQADLGVSRADISFAYSHEHDGLLRRRRAGRPAGRPARHRLRLDRERARALRGLRARAARPPR